VRCGRAPFVTLWNFRKNQLAFACDREASSRSSSAASSSHPARLRKRFDRFAVEASLGTHGPTRDGREAGRRFPARRNYLSMLDSIGPCPAWSERSSFTSRSHRLSPDLTSCRTCAEASQPCIILIVRHARGRMHSLSSGNRVTHALKGQTLGCSPISNGTPSAPQLPGK